MAQILPDIVKSEKKADNEDELSSKNEWKRKSIVTIMMLILLRKLV